jgi:hypothetical protein
MHLRGWSFGCVGWLSGRAWQADSIWPWCTGCRARTHSPPRSLPGQTPQREWGVSMTRGESVRALIGPRRPRLARRTLSRCSNRDAGGEDEGSAHNHLDRGAEERHFEVVKTQPGDDQQLDHHNRGRDGQGAAHIRE